MTGLRFSPFSWLFETREYPHARTLRSSYGQKLKDSFFVTTGKIDDTGKTIITGLFDYLTGFIPFALLGILLWSLYNIETKKGKAVVVPALLLNIPLLLCRVLFGALITLGFSLVTLIVHGISRIVAKQTFDAVLSYGEEHSLSAFLDENNCDIGNLSVSQTEDQIVLLDSKSQKSLKLRVSATDASFASKYPALFRLNVGGIQSHEEERALEANAQAASIQY